MPKTRAIGEILRDAAAGRLENILAEDREPYDLIGAADRLFDILRDREIDYVLVGGIAMLQYVEGRNTVDIDLILSPASLEALPELAVRSCDQDFARAQFERVQVDLLVTQNEVFDLVLREHSNQVEILGRRVTVATPQGLLILKLFALPSLYCQGEKHRAAIYAADILGLLVLAETCLESALETLGHDMLASDVVELRRIADQLRGRGNGFS